jgi:hypothetical protein
MQIVKIFIPLTLKKMVKKLVLFGIFISISTLTFCQSEYWVFFTDKKGVKFDPYSYFDKKAIERRNNLGISLYDEKDFPLNQHYINQVAEIVTEIDIQLRWFNVTDVRATDDEIKLVGKLPFVKKIIKKEPFDIELAKFERSTVIDFFGDDEYILQNQTERLDGKIFVDNGIDGKGVRIAIFDGGFPNYDIHEAFEHIRNDNRIIKTWDFTKKNANVSRGSSHGTSTFSCVGGKKADKNIGLATGAEYMLAITEVNSEPYKEEKWWLAAMEWADKNGADIISSSLGYVNQRYFPEEMDGHHSLVSEAARIAVRKGMLVVNSAGNEATNKNWKTIITPSDVDSVLTIGGIDPTTNYHINFSSFGPTRDGKMKPNVSAFGKVMAAEKNGFGTMEGTSFSCPLVSGFAACAWQTKRELNNMQLFSEIEKSADLYPYFDYAHGYGVPQASYFIPGEADSIVVTFQMVENENHLTILANDMPEIEYDSSYMEEEYEQDSIENSNDGVIDEEIENTDFEINAIEEVDTVTAIDEPIMENEELMDSINTEIIVEEIEPDTLNSEIIEEEIEVDTEYQPEMEETNEEDFNYPDLFNQPTYRNEDYLYYNLMDEKGLIKKYEVIQVYQREALTIPKPETGTTLNISYKGYYQSFKF